MMVHTYIYGTQLHRREESVVVTFIEYLLNFRKFEHIAQFLINLQWKDYNPDFTEDNYLTRCQSEVD